MATPAQIAANRLNAIKSTGPRTDEGRATSRMNALRHGVDALSLVIPGEDPAEFADLSMSYRGHFRPHGPEQEYLVETLVQSDWLRRRALRIEAEIIRHALAEPAAGLHPLGAIHVSNTAGAHALERIRRHYEAAQRAWLAAYKQLERLLIAEAEVAAALSAAAEPAPAPVPPQSEIGFVPQKPLAPTATAAIGRQERVPGRSATPLPRPATPYGFGNTIGRVESAVNIHRAL
jgi:hypothetical protein